MKIRELEQMTQALADGTLDQAEFHRLQDELRTNPAARKFFRRSMEVELLLVEAIGQRDITDGARGRMDGCMQQHRRSNPTRGMLAAAAIVMISGIIMALMMIRQTAPLAMICTAMPGTQWQVTGQPAVSDKKTVKVPEGSTLNVFSGSVKLEFESGMVMILRGPAKAKFPQLERPVLEHGWLWVDSGASTPHIELETQDLRIRNIGTRFGVRAGEHSDKAEAHLIDGQLEVNWKQPGRKAMNLHPSDKGILLPASDNPSEIPLASDPFPGLPELLAAAANYRTTLLSQGPAGYWQLEEVNGQELTNEVQGGIHGRRLIESTRVEAGVGDDDGFQGFPEDNRSIHLNGNPFSSVLMGLDLPGGVSREEGGVSFWIRRPPGGENEILWLAGDAPDEKAGFPRRSFMHTRLTATGRVEFFIENGDFDILLSSNFRITDGHWHHIAASWGPTGVELYVNGKRVARADDYGNLEKGISRGRHVRFGKPSNDLAEDGWKSFTGWVDEIALWSRPLSATEVSHQYEAAQRPPEQGHTEP